MFYLCPIFIEVVNSILLELKVLTHFQKCLVTCKFKVNIKAIIVNYFHNRFRNWRPTTGVEIIKLLAIVLAMGIVTQQNVTDYWSQDPVSNTPFFPATMSRDRFVYFIFRAIQIISLKWLSFFDHSMSIICQYVYLCLFTFSYKFFSSQINLQTVLKLLWNLSGQISNVNSGQYSLDDILQNLSSPVTLLLYKYCMASSVTVYKYCMASSVTVHIVNMRKILLPEAKPRLTVFTRMITICTVTLEAMQYLFYYTEQNYKFIQFILYFCSGGEHG